MINIFKNGSLMNKDEIFSEIKNGNIKIRNLSADNLTGHHYTVRTGRYVYIAIDYQVQILAQLNKNQLAGNTDAFDLTTNSQLFTMYPGNVYGINLSEYISTNDIPFMFRPTSMTARVGLMIFNDFEQRRDVDHDNKLSTILWCSVQTPLVITAGENIANAYFFKA